MVGCQRYYRLFFGSLSSEAEDPDGRAGRKQCARAISLIIGGIVCAIILKNNLKRK